jgi:hypothetical protein
MSQLVRLSYSLAHTNLRFPLSNIAPKHEPEFRHSPRLIWVHAGVTEGVSRRDVARMNISEVSANKKTAALEGRRYRYRSGSAARAV